MSVERSFEAWEEVQRQGQDLADRLAQGFTGLIQSHMPPPSFTWPNPQSTKLFDLDFPAQSFVTADFKLATEKLYPSGINDGVSAIFSIGNRIGQAGADFGNSLNGFMQQFFRSLPVPFRHDEHTTVSIRSDLGARRERCHIVVGLPGEVTVLSERERLRDIGFTEDDKEEGSISEDASGSNHRGVSHLGRSQVYYYICYSTSFVSILLNICFLSNIDYYAH